MKTDTQKIGLYVCMVVGFFIFSASVVMAQCPDPYPPTSIDVGRYTVEIVTPFPLKITNADDGEEFLGSDYGGPYPYYVWRYKYSGDISKITHLLHAVSYNCTREPFDIIPSSGGKVNDPYIGDKSTNWGAGFGASVVTLNPQPVPLGGGVSGSWFATLQGGVGESWIAVDTGKGTDAGSAGILGPGYDIPAYVLYSDIEKIYFEGEKFCLVREPYSKCPTEVRQCDDPSLDCEYCTSLTATDISNVIQSADGQEPGRFVGVSQDPCEPVFFQLGDNTRRVICSGGKCYVVYY